MLSHALAHAVKIKRVVIKIKPGPLRDLALAPLDGGIKSYVLIIFETVKSDQSIVLIWVSLVTNVQLTSSYINFICLEMDVTFI